MACARPPTCSPTSRSTSAGANIDKRVDDALDQLRANSSSISRGLTTGAVLLGEVLRA